MKIDIMLPNALETSSLKESENYKYQGIVEAEDTYTKKMKKKVKAEYLRRTRKVLELKLKWKSLQSYKHLGSFSLPLLSCVYRLEKREAFWN